LWLVLRHLPDYRENARRRLDILGLILFGSGIALLSYVLEIFGEHRLGTTEVLGLLALAFALLFGYAMHAEHTEYPLLRLGLFRIRTFGAAVVGSFITRLGAGGVPFLLPLLYQEGLGLTPIQSGLLIMPQAMGALGTKFFMPRLLERIGYRIVLNTNTITLGVMLMLFATITPATPIWLIVLQAFVYGSLTSMQYTCMNTLAYADVPRERASQASSIASTVQQLSISFGVAAAGLITMIFIPDRLHSLAPEMIRGLHYAFLTLGLFTMISTLVFGRLKSGDGADETRQKDIHLG
jgi:hypothetical protein